MHWVAEQCHRALCHQLWSAPKDAVLASSLLPGVEKQRPDVPCGAVPSTSQTSLRNINQDGIVLSIWSFCLFVCFVFETGFHYIGKAGLELTL